MVKLLYEDLLGNLQSLKHAVHLAATNNNWDPNWSITINQSTQPNTLAAIQIYVKINQREFIRELIVFDVELTPLSTPKKGFTIQWGFIPHPIIPLIHDWLKNVDTSKARTQERTQKLTQELIETIYHPSKFNFQDGI